MIIPANIQAQIIRSFIQELEDECILSDEEHFNSLGDVLEYEQKYKKELEDKSFRA